MPPKKRKAPASTRKAKKPRAASSARQKKRPAKSSSAAMQASTKRTGMRGRRKVEATASEAPRPSRALYLRLTFPGGDVVVFQPPEVILFGRSDECLVVLPQSNVSRRHAEIRYDDGRFCMRDLGSTNGTFRNADRAGELDIRDGDVVQIGDVAMLWEILVADRSGLRPMRDRILTDGAARLKRDRDPCAFLWLARMSRLRKKLELPDGCTHLVISLPAGEAVDVPGFAYEVAGDGRVAGRHKLDLRLPPGDSLRSILARATEDSSYTSAEISAIGRGASEGSLPADLTRLGFFIEQR